MSGSQHGFLRFRAVSNHPRRRDSRPSGRFLDRTFPAVIRSQLPPFRYLAAPLRERREGASRSRSWFLRHRRSPWGGRALVGNRNGIASGRRRQLMCVISSFISPRFALFISPLSLLPSSPTPLLPKSKTKLL